MPCAGKSDTAGSECGTCWCTNGPSTPQPTLTPTRLMGTSPATMRCAKPSTMAVCRMGARMSGQPSPAEGAARDAQRSGGSNCLQLALLQHWASRMQAAWPPASPRRTLPTPLSPMSCMCGGEERRGEPAPCGVQVHHASGSLISWGSPLQPCTHHWVVLGAPGKDVHTPPDLIVTPCASHNRQDG